MACPAKEAVLTTVQKRCESADFKEHRRKRKQPEDRALTGKGHAGGGDVHRRGKSGRMPGGGGGGRGCSNCGVSSGGASNGAVDGGEASLLGVRAPRISVSPAQSSYFKGAARRFTTSSISKKGGARS